MRSTMGVDGLESGVGCGTGMPEFASAAGVAGQNRGRPRECTGRIARLESGPGWTARMAAGSPERTARIDVGHASGLLVLRSRREWTAQLRSPREWTARIAARDGSGRPESRSAREVDGQNSELRLGMAAVGRSRRRQTGVDRDYCCLHGGGRPEL